MSDLISKAKLFNLLANVWTLEDVYSTIQDMPTEEAEKVIRCKDCKFAHITNDGRYCKYCDMFTDDYGQLIEMYFESNFYCGYAERKN